MTDHKTNLAYKTWLFACINKIDELVAIVEPLDKDIVVRHYGKLLETFLSLAAQANLQVVAIGLTGTDMRNISELQLKTKLILERPYWMHQYLFHAMSAKHLNNESIFRLLEPLDGIIPSEEDITSKNNGLI